MKRARLGPPSFRVAILHKVGIVLYEIRTVTTEVSVPKSLFRWTL